MLAETAYNCVGKEDFLFDSEIFLENFDGLQTKTPVVILMVIS